MNSQILLRLRIFQTIIILAPVTTLAISPWKNLDPISLIKVAVVSTGAFLIIGVSLPFREHVIPKLDSWIKILSLLFVASLTTSLLFSGAPIQQQFWGMFGRNTGFLTYFTLLILLISTSLLQARYFYRRIVYSLILTSLPMDLYCIVQIAGRDPIKWSEFQTFGTLGNINFLSAFLGMAAVAALSSVFDNENSKSKKFFGAVICLSNILIVSTTDSIQGILIFLVGLSTLVAIWIFTSPYPRALFWLFLSLNAGAFYFVLIGLQNKGPLRSFLFQPSVIFRGDYWHAGIEMTLQKPLFGVGLDSYGDWYRQVRGEISTLRTGPDRTSNTAHNIFLDISSNGGFPLLVAYFGMMTLILLRTLRTLKTLKRPDFVLSTTFAVWLAYQVQALVSINQVGVGIWGWIFSGALLGITRPENFESTDVSQVLNGKTLRQLKGKPLPAMSVVLGAIGLLVGFSLSFIPLKADADFRSASISGNSQQSVSILESPGITAYHYGSVIQSLVKAGSLPEAKSLCAATHEKFPKDYYAVRICYLLNEDNAIERQRWLEVLRLMDPFNPEYQ
jgi:O-antigen ligase